jgi:hypothetical protein
MLFPVFGAIFSHNPFGINKSVEKLWSNLVRFRHQSSPNLTSTSLLASGYRLLATGYWLLATGYWLLAIGYWLLATGYWLLAIS